MGFKQEKPPEMNWYEMQALQKAQQDTARANEQTAIAMQPGVASMNMDWLRLFGQSKASQSAALPGLSALSSGAGIGARPSGAMAGQTFGILSNLFGKT